MLRPTQIILELILKSGHGCVGLAINPSSTLDGAGASILIHFTWVKMKKGRAFSSISPGLRRKRIEPSFLLSYIKHSRSPKQRT